MTLWQVLFNIIFTSCLPLHIIQYLDPPCFYFKAYTFSAQSDYSGYSAALAELPWTLT